VVLRRFHAIPRLVPGGGPGGCESIQWQQNTASGRRAHGLRRGLVGRGRTRV